jgi:hypothetical protein
MTHLFTLDTQAMWLDVLIPFALGAAVAAVVGEHDPDMGQAICDVCCDIHLSPLDIEALLFDHPQRGSEPDCTLALESLIDRVWRMWQATAHA